MVTKVAFFGYHSTSDEVDFMLIWLLIVTGGNKIGQAPEANVYCPTEGFLCVKGSACPLKVIITPVINFRRYKPHSI